MTSTTAKLHWEGLGSLAIPAKVADGCMNPQIDVFMHEIKDLPEPLNTADLWIYCRSAWPHPDPDFEGSVFITLAVQADHIYSQVIPNGRRIELGVFPGYLFVTDPLSLHWLAPSNEDTNQGFIGLQWEVPHHKLADKWAELCSKLGQLGTLQTLSAEQLNNILPPREEYEGSPPSPVH